MKHLHFDCYSGAAGDMINASLLDLGVDIADLRAALSRLNVAPFEILQESVSRGGIVGRKFSVSWKPEDHPDHRHYSSIRKLIQEADLPARAKERAIAAFHRLAEAEATVHGTDIEKVHFHEVGAVDAIADIVGAMWLLERLGPERITCTPVPTGSGTVKCAHGTLPVPAPATALLLKGVPLAACDEQCEMLTPTAAAILTTVVDEFGAMPALTIDRVGTGAGTRELKSRPNLLRAILGETNEKAVTKPTSTAQQVVCLETNLDDVSPESVGFCVDRLFDAGVLDAWTSPIYMKKHRPGTLLAAIARPEDVEKLEKIIFEETGSFGIRRRVSERTILERHHVQVETEFGPIRVKVGKLGDAVVVASPEYEDCAAAAKQHNVPLHTVMDAARFAVSRA